MKETAAPYTTGRQSRAGPGGWRRLSFPVDNEMTLGTPGARGSAQAESGPADPHPLHVEGHPEALPHLDPSDFLLLPNLSWFIHSLSMEKVARQDVPDLSVLLKS